MRYDEQSSPGSAALSLVAAADPTGWEAEAHCRGSDGLLFFGPHGFESKRDRATREEAAKRICAGCPAMEACRAYALEHGEHYGVWGGLGETERRQLLERDGRIARAG